MSSSLVRVGLPLALAIVMFGLGLGLTLADFARVRQQPRAVLVGLACQLLLLPAVCLGLVHLFQLPPVLAVGMMLLAASPGGTTANIFSHLFRGDVALNVTLTALNSVLAAFTLPVVVNFALARFMGTEQGLGLQLDKVLQVFGIVLVPVALGLTVRGKAPAFAKAMDTPVRIISLVVLVAVIAGTVAAERKNLPGYFASVGLAAGVFCVFSLTVGYLVPRLLRVEQRQAIATCMEIGIHNSTLAITLAISPQLLNNTQMAVPAAVYAVVMFFIAAGFGFVISRGAPAAAPSVSPQL